MANNPLAGAAPLGQLGWRAPIVFRIQPPLMVAHGDFLKPALLIAIAIQPPAMTATAVFRVPTVSSSRIVAVPVSQAVAAMLIPSVGISYPVLPPIMLATAAMLTPVVSSAVGMLPPKMSAVAAMLTPSAGIGVNIPVVSPVMAAIASMMPGSSGVSVSDNFVRANSTTSPGPGWTNRNGILGISSNQAYAVSGGVWCVASNNTPMAANDMEASITLGTLVASDYVFVGLGFNATGEGVIAVTDSAGGGNLTIYTVTDWTIGSATSQGQTQGNSWSPGDELKIKRVGNVYTIYLRGGSSTVWVDSGNLIPRDSSHWITAIGTFDAGSGSRHIAGFNALSGGGGGGAGPTVSAGVGMLPPVMVAAGVMRVPTIGVDESMAPPAMAAATAMLVPTVSVTFNETNINRTNQTRPAGVSGCWVTLIGGGASGGAGLVAASGNRSGGGGGGGAGMISRVFIPVASLGSTYSVTRGLGATTNGTAGAASIFSSGGITLTANGGGGGNIPTGVGVAGVAGTGGTASAVGITATTLTGGAGGAGGDGTGASPNAPSHTTDAAPAGGSGGGSDNSANNVFASGTGGDSATAVGGASAPGGGGSTHPGGNGTTGNGGAGGSGSGGRGSGPPTPGKGGSPGGGGGGGGGTASGVTNGGPGGDGYTLVEWV